MKASEYEKIVEDCRKSGMTIREYSEKLGVSVETVHTWIRRTRKRYGLSANRKGYDEYRSIVLKCKSECKKSGQQAKDWCAERGIAYTTYIGWVKKVHRKEGREVIDRLCGIDRSYHGRKPEPKIKKNPVLCEIRR